MNKNRRTRTSGGKISPLYRTMEYMMAHRIVRISLVAFCTAVWCVTAIAQQKQQQPQDAYGEQDHFEFMSNEFNLTPEQRPKVKAIVDAQMQQWAVLGKN